MKPTYWDERAELAYAFAKALPKAEAKEAIAGMFGMPESMAEALIARGKALARQKGEKVG